jgi:hypothetical protein
MNGKVNWVGVSWMVGALLPLVAGMAVAANTSSTQPPINTESPVATVDTQPSQSNGPLSCLAGCSSTPPEPAPPASAPAVAPPLEHNGFSRLGFQVLDGWGVRQRDGSPVVMGEVKNIGSIAQGVKLQMIQRDTAGRVLDEDEFWPASDRNIAPGETEPFARPLLNVDPTMATVELRIVEARPW